MSAPTDVVQGAVTVSSPSSSPPRLAWWDANVDATEEHEQRRVAAELALSDALADAELFRRGERRADERRRWDSSAASSTCSTRASLPRTRCRPHLRHRIVELETRGRVDLQQLPRRRSTASASTTTRSARSCARATTRPSAAAAWEASKQIGPEVADRVRELARLRNQAARALGLPRPLRARAGDRPSSTRTRLFATLDDVDRATASAVHGVEAAIDARSPTRFGCAPAELRPWHYDDPFFQEAPPRARVDLDHLFADADLEALTVRTYDGLGLDVAPVLDRSDLYARDGKSQHAFCIDIDREGDVRVLCNVEPERALDGHDAPRVRARALRPRVDRSLPWLAARRRARCSTTEGIAMLMGRLAQRRRVAARVAGVDAGDVDALAAALAGRVAAALLVFARWVLVMTNFERALYADPDADLDTLWWDLVERYQLVRRPTAGAHPTGRRRSTSPARPSTTRTTSTGSCSRAARRDARRAGRRPRRPARGGALLVEEVFRPGQSVRWDALLEQATGEPLTAAHAARFIERGLAAGAS